MRELQLIHALFVKSLQSIKMAGSNRVVHVRLALGELLELDRASFLSHWNGLSKGTPLEHAQLHLRLIPAEVQCMACFQKYQPAGKQIHCPNCGSFGAKILSGEECYLESIEPEHD